MAMGRKVSRALTKLVRITRRGSARGMLNKPRGDKLYQSFSFDDFP